MWRYLATALMAGALYAQTTTPGPVFTLPVPPTLVQYLELTTSQTASIQNLYSRWIQYSLGKAQRSAQVQMEISQETAKETMDPMALGVRYLELEGIRRELAAEQQRTVTDVQNVLTPAQKTKLAALQDTLKMYPTACDALSYNFIQPAPSSGVFSFVSTVPAIGILTAVPTAILPTCSAPGLAVRTGDFTSAPTTVVRQPLPPGAAQ